MMRDARCIMHHASCITHHASCIMHHVWQIDANRLANNSATLHRTWTIPLKFTACLLLLYQTIGPSAFAGALVMVVLAPGNYLAMKAMLKYTRAIQTARDRRVKLLTEVLSGVKIVKLLGWEHELNSQVEMPHRHANRHARRCGRSGRDRHRHGYGHAYGHAYGHVYRHVYRHVHRHACGQLNNQVPMQYGHPCNTATCALWP